MKIRGKTISVFILVLLVVWQILLTFQGLDLADTGFQLTAYRFIFSDPYSVQYSMMYWLSDVCGHWWMSVNPAGGLHWARVGWVVVISLTFAGYLYLLRRETGFSRAVAGLAVTTVFILQGGPECLNYDIFSAFGIGLGLIVLHRALVSGKTVLLLLSGIVFGVSLFFKLSNLTSLAFVGVFVFNFFLKKQNLSQFFLKILAWLGGYIVGAVLVLSLIKISGHLDLFTGNLSFLAEMGQDSGSTHGITKMLGSYFSGYFNAAVLLSLFLLAVVVYGKLSSRFAALKSPEFYPLIIIVIVVVSAGLGLWLGDVFWSKVRYLFLGAMIFQGIRLMTQRGNPQSIRLIALEGLILLLIAPLGSDSGLEKSVWGMWILGPMLLSFPEENSSAKLFRLEFTGKQTRLLKYVLGSLVLSASIIHAWQKTYFDAGSRLAKTVAVDHAKLRCIYTGVNRAKVVNELIHDGFPLIQDQKYVLSFIEIPMINYLADKPPFISTSWPKLYNNPDKFRLKLEEAVNFRKTFPAIVRQKQNTMLAEWPVKADPDYLKYPESLSKWPEHGKILNEFISRNNYRVVWENEMFQILIRE